MDSAKSRTATLTLHTADPEAVLKVPVEVRLIELVECRPAQLYLERETESAAVIRRTIEVRPRPDVTLAHVRAVVRGVPGSVTRIRQVPEGGVWEVELEFGPWTGQTGMAIGVVEVSGAPEGDVAKIEVPVYVR